MLLTWPMLDMMRKNSLKLQERKFKLDITSYQVNRKYNNTWMQIDSADWRITTSYTNLKDRFGGLVHPKLNTTPKSVFITWS